MVFRPRFRPRRPRTAVAVASLLLAGLSPALAQRPPDPQAEVQREAMRRLEYLAGDWQGEGWVYVGDSRQTFRGGELVQSKLDGLALLVEGSFFGRLPGSDEEVPTHQTLGVISYDPESEGYLFRTWLARGNYGERRLELTDNGWSWEIRNPKGVLRYVMTLTDEGEWLEIGERSRDEESWEKFFEMRLRKLP